MDSRKWTNSKIQDKVTKLNKLMSEHAHYDFEDGMDSPFSEAFIALATPLPSKFYEMAAPLFWHVTGLSGKAEPTEQSRHRAAVASEAVLQLAYIENDETLFARKRLVEESLLSKNHYIRDKASTAISILDDPASLPALIRASHNEEYTYLQRVYKDIIQQLLAKAHQLDEQDPIY